MAIIPLRAYNREIESMIDNGQLDESVAHCRHILATFPKHIATYRLLGKAHLEQQRISDATDIFQRVLTAIPDDFISNVGMSIIREDENNLDAAIWHMELAYEAQPANIAIQDELRRLYGRRDGMQPPKVRMTRGALARMYVKGGLYDQAIAELRAAIAEEPNRPDLQVLLAQMFYMTSQRIEAVETSVNILKIIPMCLEANRILAISLPDAEGSEAVKGYRQAVISMDPYYAFAEPDSISSEQVPENAVNIERLEWKSGIQIGETPNQPTWATSLGISMEKPAEDNIPEWLKSAEAPPAGVIDDKTTPTVSPFIWDTQEVEKIITDTSKPEGDIPDWMKDAGWQPASGSVTPPPESVKPEQPAVNAPVDDNLEKAEIPEWLRGAAPEGVLGEDKHEIEPKEDEHINPWLEPHQPGPTDSIIQWLEEKKPDATATTPGKEGNFSFGEDEEVPDWLKDIDVPQSKPGQEETPVESAPAFSLEQPVISEGTSTTEPAFPSAEAANPEIPTHGDHIIQPVQPEPIIPQEITQPQETPAAFAEEIPDWLREIAGDLPAAGAFVTAAEASGGEATASTKPVPTAEQPSLGEDHPVEDLPGRTEDLATPKTEAFQDLPVGEQTAATESLPVGESPIQPDELPQAVVEPNRAEESTLMPTTSEKFLPTQAPVEMPAIVEDIAPIKEEQPTAKMAAMAEDIAPIEAGTEADALPTQGLPAAEEQQPQAENTPAEPELPGEPLDLSWLEGLVAEQPLKGEELVTPTAEGEIPPPEWVSLESEPTQEGTIEQPSHAGTEAAVPAAEIPDWIKGLGEEPEPSITQEEPAAPVPAETEIPQAEELPPWLLELEQPEPTKETDAGSEEALEFKSDELPDWLKEITETRTSEITSSMPMPSGVDIPSQVAEAGSGMIQENLPSAETPAVEESPAPITETIPGKVGEIAPAIPGSTEAIEGLTAQAVPQNPELQEPAQAAPLVASEAEAEPSPVPEETPTRQVEITTTAMPEAAVPVAIPLDEPAAALTDARDAINQSQPLEAVGHYSNLIKQNYRLSDIIKDLQQALYRFPVDVNMWITLGDAHHRSANLQEALDAYTKAEELAR